MKGSASVSLRREINEGDVTQLLKWLSDPEVTEYLSDDKRSVLQLSQMRSSLPPYLWQMELNQNGYFYIVDIDRKPSGFIRLCAAGAGRYEIVIVLGKKETWGRGYGTKALDRCLYQAFFEHRARELTANIRPCNLRSLHVFEKNDFKAEKGGEAMLRYFMTRESYMSREALRA